MCKRIIAICLFGLLANVYCQNICESILKYGIYDQSESISDMSRAEAFANWFNQQNISTYKEAESWGLFGSIPIGNYMLNLGFTLDETGFRQFKNYISTFSTRTYEEKQKLVINVKTINKDVVEAWSNCINSAGLKIWYEQTQNPYEFVLCAKHVQSGHEIATLENVQFSYDNEFLFGDGPLLDQSGKPKDKLKIEGNTLRHLIRRRYLIPTNVVITPSEGGVSTISLGGVMTLLPVIHSRFIVEAVKEPWSNTSLYCKKGQRINIKVDAGCNWKLGIKDEACNAEGYYGIPTHPTYPQFDTRYNYGALLAKIANKVYLVGLQTEFVVEDDGILSFTCNDGRSTTGKGYEDNIRSMSLSIVISEYGYNYDNVLPPFYRTQQQGQR
ncbi:MAG: hypothetical protein WCZ90_19755 [Melioribacteraceae bacterium]